MMKNSFSRKKLRRQLPKLDTADVKKLAIKLLPYLIFEYLGDKVSWLYRHSPGANASLKAFYAIAHLKYAFLSLFPSMHLMDLLCGAGFSVAIYLVLLYRRKNAKKYRNGMEYGSARWGTASDIKPFINPVFAENIPLTQTERLTMESRPKLPKYARNKNIVVIGGSGSGKTRFFIKPSLMQMHSSYVATDPKGTLIVETGQMLVNHGYSVKTLKQL